MTAHDGALVVVEEKHDLPLVRLTLTLRSGAAEDPPELSGLAQYASELVKRGAAGRSREELDARFDAIGAELSVAVGHDSVTWDVEVMSQHLDTALALVADVVLRPDLARSEAEQLVRETHASLDELEEDDPQLARRFFSRALYGDHPYGRPALGTRATIDRLGAEPARRWIERVTAAGNLIVGAAGDVDEARFRELVARRFGVLRSGQTPLAALDPVDERPRPRVTIVDKPGRTQTQILLGQRMMPWRHPDFTALSLGVHGFGGTFTSRLMTEVRVKRGLSYGASARIGQGRGPRPLVLYVFPALERTAETLGLVLDLWREWAEAGLRSDELAFVRDNLANAFVFETVTPEDRLDLRVAAEVCELPPGFVADTVARVRATGDEEVHAAMKRHLAAIPPVVTLLGTASKLEKQLAKLPLGEITVLPYDRF